MYFYTSVCVSSSLTRFHCALCSMPKRERSISPPPDDTVQRAQWLRKYVCVEPETISSTLSCNIAPCRHRSFVSAQEYESHYNSVHRHVCLECQAIFPSNHFLELHLAEAHDPIRRIRMERGESVLQCFEESCTRTFATPKLRRRHLIDKHKYPKTFHFSITMRGIEFRRGTTWLDHRPTFPKEPKDIEMQDASRNTPPPSSTQRKMPQRIHFGRS